MSLLLQIIVLSCFVVVILALFRDKADFLYYSMVAMLVSAAATFLLSPGVSTEEVFLAVDWEVIFFLISLFTIVAILEEQCIFQEVARRITTKFSTNTRKFFWVICLISTVSAAFIEDISVAVIFIPMIISTSRKMKINPVDFINQVQLQAYFNYENRIKNNLSGNEATDWISAEEKIKLKYKL